MAGSGVGKEIFLEEINFLTDHKPWSYVDVYNLPIPIRRWFVRKIVEKIEKSQGNPNTATEPLTPAQKQKMINDSSMANNTPGRTVTNPFGPTKK